MKGTRERSIALFPKIMSNRGYTKRFKLPKEKKKSKFIEPR